MMHYTELQHIGFYLTNYADRLVGIKLASKLTTIKWQKKLQFTITQYNTEQNNIIQIFEVSLMPIMAEHILG